MNENRNVSSTVQGLQPYFRLSATELQNVYFRQDSVYGCHPRRNHRYHSRIRRIFPLRDPAIRCICRGRKYPCQSDPGAWRAYHRFRAVPAPACRAGYQEDHLSLSCITDIQSKLPCTDVRTRELYHCFYKYLIPNLDLFHTNPFLLIEIKADHISFIQMII